MRHQKPHRDVFRGQKFDVLFLGVAPAPVKNEDSTVVEVPEALSEVVPCCLNVWDEDFFEPEEENITVDEACLGPVDGDVFWRQPLLEKPGIERLVSRDDCRLQTRPVSRNAPDKCAASC